MHIYRWITGIIAVPILIYLIGPGPRWLFYGLVCLVAVIGLREFYQIAAPRLPRWIRWTAAGLMVLLFFALGRRQVLLVPAILSFWACIPMAYFMFSHPGSDPGGTSDMGKAALGPLYVGLPLAMLVLMDLIPRGNLWIFFLLAVIFAGDTAAFYCGRLFGKHKLHETVSPNKTWEGAVGALIGSLGAAWVFLSFMDIHKKNGMLLILVCTLSVSGQIGDLSESLIKRTQGVKDSGRLLPGHGGILDRIDALLFAAPVLYLYLHLFLV